MYDDYDDDYDSDDVYEGRTSLSLHYLGMKPYLLFEVTGFEESGDLGHLDVSMDMGGGVGSTDVVPLLELILSHLKETNEEDRAVSEDDR